MASSRDWRIRRVSTMVCGRCVSLVMILYASPRELGNLKHRRNWRGTSRCDAALSVVAVVGSYVAGPRSKLISLCLPGLQYSIHIEIILFVVLCRCV